MLAALSVGLSLAFAPATPLSASSLAPRRHTAPSMAASPGLGRRAALLGLVALPQMANADAIAEIAAKNALAAEEAKSPEALAKIKEKESSEENGALLASLGISALLFGSTALSMAPVSQNVGRVATKLRTGKGRKY